MLETRILTHSGMGKGTFMGSEKFRSLLYCRVRKLAPALARMFGMIFGLCILLAGRSLSAAGPMTHLYFAERFCEMTQMQGQEAIQEFLVGNLFPDIRYLGEFGRTETHFDVTSLDEIVQEKNSFLAGMKFHSWIDRVRERFVEESGIYADVALYTDVQPHTFLKFVEEEILADLYDGRKWSFCFDAPHSEELFFGASLPALSRWHEMIQYSMGYRPSWLLWGASYLKNTFMRLSSDTLYAWSYLLPKCASMPRFKEHWRSLDEKILSEIERFTH